MSARALRALGGLVLAVTTCLDEAPARAEPATAASVDVRLAVPDCLGVSGDEVKRLVAIELAPRAIIDADAVPDADTEITGSVTCSDPVTVAVDDPQRATPLRQSLDLKAAAPQARTRLLALTLAELIATDLLERTPADGSRREKASARAPQPDGGEDDGAGDDGQPSDTAPVLHQVWIAPALSRTGAPSITALGADLGALQRLGPFALQAELQARWGQAREPDAELALHAYSFALALSPVLGDDDAQVTLGAGARVGIARLSAEARSQALDGDALTGLWLGPIAVAAGQLRLTGPLALRLGLELGYAAREVRGHDEQGEDLLALRGAWASAGLGLSLLAP